MNNEKREDEIERAYWVMAAAMNPALTQTPRSARDAFKLAVRDLLHRLGTTDREVVSRDP
jgi:hypothetical protein